MAKHTAKDQTMAAALKAAGVKRETGRCPICCEVVSIRRLYEHVAFHK